MADIIIISKVNTAKPEDVEVVRKNVAQLNPHARTYLAEIQMSVDNPNQIKGRKVLVVEDGPTVTHGGMSFGAATLMAKKLGALIVDPKPYLLGSFKKVYDLYPHIDKVLPAVGYSQVQMNELNAIINNVHADLVLLGTPTDISRYLNIKKPCYLVKYELREVNEGEIWSAIKERLLEKLG
jgi:predicted GTPase